MTMLDEKNDDSFKVEDDNNWWHPPPETPTDVTLSIDETPKKPEPSDQPKMSDPIEDGSQTKSTTEKKKKVKRISTIKVKAGDMAGLSGHQFQQTGNFEADQKELQKIVMKLKADKISREGTSKDSGTTNSPAVIKPRSKSKMRTGSNISDESEPGNDHRQRSKSNGRGGRDADIVDLTTPEKRSASVARRSRSVSRKSESDESDSCPRSEENKKSGTSIGTRGRSVNTKRTNGASTKDEVEGKKSDSRNGKVRERSRSVARQRISDVDNYGDNVGNSTTNYHSVQGRRRSGTVDLASGLALVDRDTRSRSVARKRPGEEDTKDVYGVHCFQVPQKSASSRSKISSKSDETEMRRSKSVGRKVKSNADESVSHASSNEGSITKAIDSISRRSKSVGRKVRSSDETSSLHSSKNEISSSETVDSERRRSKSVGRTRKTVEDSVPIPQTTSNDAERKNMKVPEFHDISNTGKSIPWNEFLKHAQSVHTRTTGSTSSATTKTS